MKRSLIIGLIGGLLAATDATAQVAVQADTTAAGIYRRAQRLVNDGQGAEGRALVDSMLNAAEPRSPAEAEALYWHAMLAESWDNAQRDYLRLMLEHERSPRAGDAMLRLAQGEVARGDREAAIRYLERLVREAPESPARAEAGLWHGRLLLEQGDATRGCAMLREARPRVAAGALELENQFEYVMRACPDAAAAVSPAPAPTAQPASPTTTPTTTPPMTPPTGNPAAANPPAANPPAANPPAANPPATNPPPAAAPSVTTPPAATKAPAGSMWSFQVAALSSLADANAMVARLRERGYDARVDGRTAPFRVRIGRYATKAEAAMAGNAYKAKERGDFVLAEVPRGSF